MKLRLIYSAFLTLGLAFLAMGAMAQTEIESFTDTACLDCHTSESTLRELAPAEEEEEAESLSSGPG